jgi:hypothetical protein
MPTPDQINKTVALCRNQYYQEGEVKPISPEEQKKIDKRREEINHFIKTLK